MATDRSIQYDELMVGKNHPSLADTLNRLTLIGHNTDGSHKGYVEASQEGSLTATIAAVGTSVPILITNAQTITSNATISNPLIICPGGVINVTTGIAVTLSGTLTAGAYQIFTGVGTVTISKNKVPTLLPQWWGAVPDSSSSATNNTSAINKAITNAVAQTIPVELTALFYTNGVMTYYSGLTIFGHGIKTGIISSYDGAAFSNTYLSSDHSDVTFKDFAIYGISSGGSNSVGVSIDRMTHMTLENVNVEGRYYISGSYSTGGFSKAGILFIAPVDSNTISNVSIVNSAVTYCAGDGVQTNGGTVDTLISGTRIFSNGAYGIHCLGTSNPDRIAITSCSMGSNTSGDISGTSTSKLSYRKIGTWVPVPADVTLASGTAAATYAGYYTRDGNMVDVTIICTPADTTTIAFTSTTTKFDLPTGMTPLTVGTASVVVNTLAAATGGKVATDGYLYPMTVSAVNSVIVLSARYRLFTA